MAIKELWRGRRFYTSPYPLLGARSAGTALVPVDLLKQIQEDTIDTLSIHLIGNVVVAGTLAGAGAPNGNYNPQSLVTLTTLTTAPQASGLIPLNAISPRIAVLDQAVLNGSFASFAQIPDTPGTFPLDAWVHFGFKRPLARKGIEFAHPLRKWKTDVLNVVFGTRDQLFTGGTNTWDLTAVTVEFFADMDVAAAPDNIHAVELFELDFNIVATNSSFIINQLPAGTYYDNLYIVTEDPAFGGLTDAMLVNIDVEGAGRFWLPQGENNAAWVRNEFTKPAFWDQTQDLTGIYILPLRDGMWSRALDAVAQPIVLRLNVNSLSTTSLVRLGGRKIVPGGIKKTIKGPDGKKTVVGLPDA
jgi:hypothetical protein